MSKKKLACLMWTLIEQNKTVLKNVSVALAKCQPMVKQIFKLGYVGKGTISHKNKC